MALRTLIVLSISLLFAHLSGELEWRAGSKWTESTVLAEVVYAYNKRVLITDLQYIDGEE